MTPIYKITVDGGDRTTAFARRLLSISLTDEEGIKSDAVEIELDNGGAMIAIPEHGAELKVALGFRETGLTDMGTYVVDSIGGSGPEETLRIGGKAVDMRGGVRSPKSRAWEAQTLRDIAEKIAGEAGLTASVGESIGSTFFPFLSQSAESDLHLLTRLARPLDATAKVAEKRLIVVKRGEGKTASGRPIEPMAVTKSMLQSWEWELGDRGDYKQVEAAWADLDTAEEKTVSAGGGEPKKRLRPVFSSQSEAQGAAKAALDKAERGASSLDAEMAIFAPALFAGGLVSPLDLGSHLAGDWHLKSVEHALDDSGLRSSFKAEKTR